MPTKIEPREHPILFSGPMVRAMLDGRKTQARRVIVPQPDNNLRVPVEFDGQKLTHAQALETLGWKCPYGRPGGRLWVREAWAKDIPGCSYGLAYRADHLDPKGDGPANPIKWKPSIHMPKWVARIWLEVTGIRVECVQDISYEDARAEGVKTIGMDITIDPPIGDCGGIEEILDPVKEYQNLWDTLNAVKEYQNLWDTLNAKRGYGWDQNPWVWVVDFKGGHHD